MPSLHSTALDSAAAVRAAPVAVEAVDPDRFGAKWMQDVSSLPEIPSSSLQLNEIAQGRLSARVRPQHPWASRATAWHIRFRLGPGRTARGSRPRLSIAPSHSVIGSPAVIPALNFTTRAADSRECWIIACLTEVAAAAHQPIEVQPLKLGHAHTTHRTRGSVTTARRIDPEAAPGSTAQAAASHGQHRLCRHNRIPCWGAATEIP